MNVGKGIDLDKRMDVDQRIDEGRRIDGGKGIYVGGGIVGVLVEVYIFCYFNCSMQRENAIKSVF